MLLRRLVILVPVLVLANAFRAAPQPAPRPGVVPALKAAFLYNFTKFAEWPADALAPAQRLSLCVIGDNAIASALENVIHPVEGHEVIVQILKTGGPMRSCHILYVDGLDAAVVRQTLAALQGAPVLTVSDGEKFAASGGIVQLILGNDQIRFAINVEAARRVRVQLSSRLLSLATIVTDDHDVQP